MKQVIQNYQSGRVTLEDVPVPVCVPGTLIVKNHASLLSLGTERSIIELGKKSIIGKAQARPDLVRRFFEKSKQEGLGKTVQEAFDRLNMSIPLGYSAAGTVVEVGSNVHSFLPGYRIACIGQGYASHAEYIRVPERLCMHLPNNVSFEEGSFGMLGGIALHGIRSATLTFGESVLVIGLGLLGLLTIQIARAYGCRVFGTDVDANKIALVQQMCPDGFFGTAEELKSRLSNQVGEGFCDAVIIATATSDDSPIHLAIDCLRLRGRIVVVGVLDIHPHRNDLWRKEIEIIVSRAAGPGSSDHNYEVRGDDYPSGLVRWTEQRNLEEFIRLVSTHKIEVASLISHRIPISEAESIYSSLMNNGLKGAVGIIFVHNGEQTVDKNASELNRVTVLGQSSLSPIARIPIGVIGTGTFARSVFLPILNSIPSFFLHTLAASSGVQAAPLARKFCFQKVTTDYRSILSDPEVRAVFILSPHRLHASMILDALAAGKHIFVEKPLCVTVEELVAIQKAFKDKSERGSVLMVGYNRRYSPHMTQLSSLLENRAHPLVCTYRVNAGFLDPNHWAQRDDEGGRIIGEMCHFVDCIQFLTNSHANSAYTLALPGSKDSLTASLSMSDGSLATVVYQSVGDRGYPKEFFEVASGGMICTIRDFKETHIWRNGRLKKFKTWRKQFGYHEELEVFRDMIMGKISAPEGGRDFFSASHTIFAVLDSLKSGKPTYLNH